MTEEHPIDQVDISPETVSLNSATSAAPAQTGVTMEMMERLMSEFRTSQDKMMESVNDKIASMTPYKDKTYIRQVKAAPAPAATRESTFRAKVSRDMYLDSELAGIQNDQFKKDIKAKTESMDFESMAAYIDTVKDVHNLYSTAQPASPVEESIGEFLESLTAESFADTPQAPTPSVGSTKSGCDCNGGSC